MAADAINVLKDFSYELCSLCDDKQVPPSVRTAAGAWVHKAGFYVGDTDAECEAGSIREQIVELERDNTQAETPVNTDTDLRQASEAASLEFAQTQDDSWTVPAFEAVFVKHARPLVATREREALKAGLREAARRICPGCRDGCRPTMYMNSRWHPEGSVACRAASIHDMIAELERETP